MDYCVDKHMTILCIQRADGVHYGKPDHVRPHAASVSNTPPVPSPSRPRGIFQTARGTLYRCIYVCIDCKSVSVCMYMLCMRPTSPKQHRLPILLCVHILFTCEMPSRPGCLWWFHYSGVAVFARQSIHTIITSHIELCTRSSNQLCHYQPWAVKRAHMVGLCDCMKVWGLVNYCANIGPATAVPAGPSATPMHFPGYCWL